MFSVLVKLGWFFKRHWIRYTIAIFLLILVGVLEIIPPKLLGVAVDYIQNGTLTFNKLLELILILGGLAIVIYVITYVWMYQLFGGSFLVERTKRSRLMKHLLKMTPTFYEKNKTGDLMARATNDLKAISMTAGFGVLTLVDSSIYAAVILLSMGFMISWKLTFAAIIPLPLMALAMNKYGKVLHERFTEAQNSFGEMNDQVLESIAGVRVVRAYVQERADQGRFAAATTDVYNKNISVAKVDSLFEPTIKILVGCSYLIGLGYGSYLVFHNELTLGELVTFNIYLGMMIWPMFAIGELINVMQRGNASLDRVSETLSYEPDVRDKEQTIKVAEAKDIKFKNVTFRYPSSTFDNLKDVSFSLGRGETLGIVGKTGSGKTTLLKQLLREYPLGRGNVTISETSIEDMSLHDLGKWIGYVPQEQILFSKTVRENILFGKSEGNEREIEKALELASFKSDLNTLPEGLKTLVGEKGVALSGGQKQRVSIARAIIANPEILILDDALSAVDGKTEARIISNLQRERKGKTTLISTHRLSAIQHADCILVLDNGEIVQQGTHEQLVKEDGWYKEQYERQQLDGEE
ncbi:ABC transporter ATP-binding protein [Chengkuizengella axinellae]|uniref:ABC transporter transmembrane domain-containing protein n=1 Tax=Chengkuizengella axinellae TaxID=3064388 RepID=A0ABT9J2J0_9BACL|nr:ABC transporter transmembrane domain-containing protein [Chengkuizengella sp. 2205SS18-9]MDP5275802.1 ABC transporter transmembrane domain-containing protein [Chengkuizengella sp. 2205SS18-9]